MVTRTRDGSKTFDVLSKGLPQKHAYDLVYRHGLDVDATGDRWRSAPPPAACGCREDQGDSWPTISTTLPPIYAVKFVG